ncbi:uncharacterized protein LOC105169333 [Sesamum indicum]|uniref:Uncharacterized protein LOC105169333 n=1 Tax=Sesamum indicum TaxID=4182 RepID=A0A6I9TW81_SESIN|nr:uncharacterized protein LOC105169333 [Sesamum indicum]
MAEYQEKSSKLSPVSSPEIRDSIGSSNAGGEGGDEEFYEKIEAPKFVDFTVPDHFRPDDRYWFCHRVGCDQKHEEEMDSEAIYKNFVLRVMAARSPNIRFRKALDRNASRTPIKCPLSAPPKSSKPRVSRMAIISSISEKMVDDKKRVVRPILKPRSTPVTKTKPVAAKYLTTPRNRKCVANENTFRSVQNPKPTNSEEPKSRIVAKALVFRSPKKAIKVKTSVELRTPISKLCDGMDKLEISSQRKRALGYSGKSSKNLINNPSKRPVELLGSQTCTNQEAKSGRSIKSKIKGKLLQKHASKKLLGNNHTDSSNNNESCDIKQVANKVEEGVELQESIHEEACVFSDIPPPVKNPDLASPDDTKGEENCLDLEGSNNSKSRATNTQENNSNDGNQNSSSRDCRDFTDHLNVNNSSEGERNEHDFMDGDDKENAAASDENRMHHKNVKQHGRKIFGLHDKCGQVKKVAQAQDKNLKEGLISSATVMKLKKPKPTNPKPFRLRTDERGILKEANLEKRNDSLAPQTECANLSTPGRKLQKKQGNEFQKGSKIAGLKISQAQERSKVVASVTPESNKHQEPKPMSSPLESRAIQRLEKFRKSISPLQKQSLRPQGLVATKKEIISYLVPGQKLDVIHEASPEVLELRTARKPIGNDAHSSSRRPVTVAVGPNFHSTHVPRTCTRKLK